jgi:hypothetical protein
MGIAIASVGPAAAEAESETLRVANRPLAGMGPELDEGVDETWFLGRE